MESHLFFNLIQLLHFVEALLLHFDVLLDVISPHLLDVFIKGFTLELLQLHLLITVLQLIPNHLLDHELVLHIDHTLVFVGLDVLVGEVPYFLLSQVHQVALNDALLLKVLFQLLFLCPHLVLLLLLLLLLRIYLVIQEGFQVNLLLKELVLGEFAVQLRLVAFLEGSHIPHRQVHLAI